MGVEEILQLNSRVTISRHWRFSRFGIKSSRCMLFKASCYFPSPRPRRHRFVTGVGVALVEELSPALLLEQLSCSSSRCLFYGCAEDACRRECAALALALP